MKKAIVFLLIALLAGSTFIYSGPAAGAKKKSKQIKPAVKNSFHDVTSKLDRGGSLYLYASAEKMMQTVDEFAVKLRGMIEKNVTKDDEKKVALDTFDFIYQLINHSGMMEISGVGVSSVAVEPDLNHTKFVLHHYRENGKGLIWNTMARKPHELTHLKLLPADTVVAGFSYFKLKVLWEWVKKEAQASNLPKVKQTILSLEPMLQQQGIQLGELLDSLEGMGYVLTLDPEKKGVIPMGKHSLEIPQPGLALIFVVNNDSLFNLLKNKIPIPQKDPEPNKITIPVPPMPIDVAPLIMQKDGMLIVASNQTIVDAMFAAKKSGKGLTATREFKRLSAHIPNRGNSFRFGSAKLFQVVMDIQQKVIKATGKKDEESKMAMDFMSLFQNQWGMYGVLRHGSDGFVYTMNHGFNLENLVLLPLSVPAGIVAAIAIPNLLTALQNGKQKATMGDMKSIGLAIDSYITDHKKAPEGKTLSEIKDVLQPFYIKTLPLKDAWGNDFHYFHGTGDKKMDYAVGSGGKNGVFKGWDRTEVYIVTEMKHFDKDIIFSNGKFTVGPKVK